MSDGIEFQSHDHDRYALGITGEEGALTLSFGRGLILWTDDFTSGWMGFGDDPRFAWYEASTLTFPSGAAVSQPVIFKEAARLGLVEVRPLSEKPHRGITALSDRTGITCRDNEMTVLERNAP